MADIARARTRRTAAGDRGSKCNVPLAAEPLAHPARHGSARAHQAHTSRRRSEAQRDQSGAQGTATDRDSCSFFGRDLRGDRSGVRHRSAYAAVRAPERARGVPSAAPGAAGQGITGEEADTAPAGRAMSLYAVQKLIYQLNRDRAVRKRYDEDFEALLAEYELSDEELKAFRASDIGLLYVMGVNGQLLMHYAALRGFEWNAYIEAMREGERKYGPVRSGLYTRAEGRS